MAKKKKTIDLSPQLYGQLVDFKPRKSDLRRAALIDAVIDSIATVGIDQTSVQSVGKKSRMRRSHVIYYFPNQEVMLASAVKLVAATGQEITVAYLARARTTREQLEAYVEATFAWFERHPKHAPVMLLLYHLSSVQPNFKKLNAQFSEYAETRLQSLLHPGVKSRVNDKKIASLARAIRSLLTGNLIHYFTANSGIDYQSLKKETMEAVFSLVEPFLK